MADETPASNRISGRSAFLALLRSEGVSHLFGNPGTTELPIMHALTDEPDLTYVLGLQESIVVAMADGYARASGKLPACNVHVAPGLGNAMGTLYTAWNSGTPMILTAGQQEQGHGLTEPLLYGPLVAMASPIVKWAVEVTRLEDLPRIVHRAAKIAMTPPTGPVFISLPGDILNAFAALDLGEATRVETAVRPADGLIARLAETLLSAERPVLIAGHEIVAADAFDEAAALAETLGAPVYQQTVVHGAHYPSFHPAFMGSLTRSQPQVRDTLAPHDLMLCLGADVLRMSVQHDVDPLPDGMRVVQIGQHDWEMGKNYPAELAVRADLRETLAALVPALAERQGPAGRERAAGSLAAVEKDNWRRRRAAAAARAEENGPGPEGALDPAWLMWRLSEALPEDAILVDEGITTAAPLPHFYGYRDRHSYFGNVSGGIGWGIAASVGVKLAQPERPVVALIGDGSAQYSIQALWSAASQKLPMVFLLANNGGYRIIKQRLTAFHGNETYIGMDFEDPSIDFSALARSYGLAAERVSRGEDFEPALARALAADGPVLLEVMVERSLG